MDVARRILVALCLASLLPSGAQAGPKSAQPRPTKEGLDFFEKKIRPVLVHNCYECHSGDAAKAKGHLLLDTRDGMLKGGDSGAAIVPEHADSSLLIEAIRYEGLEMPPKDQLPDEVIDDFVQWIEMGAPDPRVGKAAKPQGKIDFAEARKFWAFRHPKRLPAPQVQNIHWPMSDVDRFVLSRQQQEKLQPVADADRVTLIRRVTFDLTGLPPTPDEVDAFVNDKSGNAYAALVDRLLASPRFGEKWARHWLDVVRYAESTGKGKNVPYRYAWRYRDYVIDALNADKPYDRFIVEQLAGDLLPAKNNAERDKLVIATGFLALGPKAVNEKRPEQFEVDLIDDQIDATSRAFLAITVACARCHDHKFDPIPTTDYYAIAGIFQSTETLAGVEAGKKSALDDRLIALKSASGGPQWTAEQVREHQKRQAEIDRLQNQVGELQKLKRLAGRKAPPAKQGRRRGQQPLMIANPYAGGNPKQIQAKIKALHDQLDALEASSTPAGNLAMGVREGSPTNCNVLVRGELKDKGPEVPRGVLTVLKTPQASRIDLRHSGRLELAHWIASKDNPLTARVMVNRVWGHLFGQGLVETVDNFGALGNEPSHPELLDMLAVQFMEQKWSIKQLIRTLVLSRVYQLSSQHNAENYAIDPSNRFFWRMERRRLEAEEIRDAMLLASGDLQLERPVGSPVMELGNAPLGNGGQGLRKTSDVRSIYLPYPRGKVPEMLQVFDGADPDLIVGRRDVTIVPTQALLLMNNPFVLKQSQDIAKRVLDDSDRDQAARIGLAFRLILGRLPSEGEESDVVKYLKQYREALNASKQANPQLAAWTSVCQTLFQSGEFRYLY
ncbi:MAG TPA: PSD1 and planctomycete cytochrome C domain-containing protein [Pirellulales bacterium]|jgi:hypothetical protein|nr:PSD1 and planctomycete cytochrome C domain-containing protein [Pirellulales bacterium]